MTLQRRIAEALAATLLADDWTPPDLLGQTERLFGRGTHRAQQRLIAALIDRYDATRYPPSPAELVAFFLDSKHFLRAIERIEAPPDPVLEPAAFAPLRGFVDLDVPQLATPGALADWLGITVEELDWFADTRRLAGRTGIEALEHYRHAFIPRASGPPRLLEAPKARLKAMQRRILTEILGKLPAHDSAYGFVRGRSCLDGAQIHAGEAVVISVDLKDFFLDTPLSRVHATYRSLGYPWAVARRLTGLSSTCTARCVFEELPEASRPDRWLQQRFGAPHLPQGAPTSPALANLAAWRLDCRLAGLARRLEARYTRYADDLTFSGDRRLAGAADNLVAAIGRIVEAEGYRLNPRKTRIMRRDSCQTVTGIVVNEHCNIRRMDYDTLKATLHNAARHGPEVANRAAHADFRRHLDGRITWVEQVNRPRGEKLRRIFEAIDWPGN
jgi:retron-type reverse transcriptase